MGPPSATPPTQVQSTKLDRLRRVTPASCRSVDICSTIPSMLSYMFLVTKFMECLESRTLVHRLPPAPEPRASRETYLSDIFDHMEDPLRRGLVLRQPGHSVLHQTFIQWLTSCSHAISNLTNSNRARPARQFRPIRKRLRDHVHVRLKVAHPIPLARSEIKMIARRNRPADAPHRLLRLTPHPKILRERPGPFDRWLVDTLRGVERIVHAVRCVVPPKCPGLAGRKNVPRLDNVEFDERVARPAVEGEISGAFGVVLPAVSYCPAVPALLAPCCFKQTVTGRNEWERRTSDQRPTRCQLPCRRLLSHSSCKSICLRPAVGS